MQPATQILAQLVAIPTVSRLSNIPLIDAIAEILEPAGWITIEMPYTAADGLQKANLVAVPQVFRDMLQKLDLLFVCHTDTVPYSESWPHATRLQERNGNLHGCGSCDVKGALAGLLAAAQRVDADRIAVPVAYAFTAEEEIGCIGASRLVESGTVRARHAIVCEPTSLHPAVAGKGYGLAQVSIRGIEAHSAFPARGSSAIHAAARLIVALEQMQGCAESADSLFDPPHTTFNVGVIQGGTAKNILAGECAFLVEWRPVPGEDARTGGDKLRKVAEQVANTTRCSVEVEVLRSDSGFANQAGGIGRVLSRMLKRPESGISFGSEATRFARISEQVVVVGPGDMQTAHSERECVPVSELNEWTDCVESLLLRGLPAD